MGCIYQRKNTKNFYIKYYRYGKPYVESAKSDKKEVAERLLKLREGEIAQGKLPSLYYDRVIFDDIAEEYLADYRINERKTVRKAERSVKNLKKEFGGLPVTRITTIGINKYIQKRKKEECANATINRELAALKRMFHLASQCTPQKVSHIPHIPMLAENNVRKGFFEYTDFLALREALPDYLRPIITFAYYSGWRKSEILNIRWNQVDLHEETVRLEPGETKNREGRNMYMEEELVSLMIRLHSKRLSGCEFVFQHDGRQIKDFRRSWTEACSKVGIPNMLFHDFRRTAVRDMVRAGIPERVAMTRTGHKTRSVFDRYDIVSPEDLKEAANKRRLYVNEMESQLQFGYSSSSKRDNVLPFKEVTN